MATDRTNNGVRGIGGIILVLGMVASIFGIGNHLNQRMNYLSQGYARDMARIEVRQKAYDVAAEASKVRRKQDEVAAAALASIDAARTAKLRAEVDFLKELRREHKIEHSKLLKRVSELEKHTCPTNEGH
tara:strand:- start:287 stop:676 length:390 start_codon:yes stop_codon:yes gene_type:complete